MNVVDPYFPVKFFSVQVANEEIMMKKTTSRSQKHAKVTFTVIKTRLI